MKVRIILILIAILGLAGFWGFRRYSREKPLILSGSIEARDIEIGSLVGGRVLEVLVQEGDRVKKGQIVVTLEAALLDLQIREQQSRIAEAQANLAKVEKGPRNEELRRARLEWENADREAKRLQELFSQGVVGRQQFEDAATKAATAKELYQELERGSRKEDVMAARAAVQREQERLAYLQRQREETIVRSPADGIVESLDLRPGDLVAPNQPIAKILEDDQLWVRVYVPEPQMGLVREGQPVTIKVDSYPDRTFSGKIVEIRNQGEYTPRNIQTLEQRYDQVFGVKIAIDPSPELKPGMAALVQLKK